MNIKENVKYILQQRGLTQVQLANRMGVTKQQIQSYINKNATIDSLLKMAVALDTTVETLVSETPLALKDVPIPSRDKEAGDFSVARIFCPHCGEEITIIAK